MKKEERVCPKCQQSDQVIRIADEVVQQLPLFGTEVVIGQRTYLACLRCQVELL